MFKWYKKVVFENYANFNGRARRSEYWYFVLMNIIALILAIMLDGALNTNFSPLPYGYIYFFYVFATLLPGLAVQARRLHDVGKSGWFMLIPIYNLILYCTEGDHGDNEYGPDPKNNDEIHEIGTKQE